MKVADAIAGVLKAEAIEHLVCYPRQLLIDPCIEVGLKPVICRQERVGVGIADGISRSTNGARIGVFSMQGGPGVENSFPGVAQLFGDNVPVLIMPGGANRDRAYTPPTFSAVDNFRNVTKWAAAVNQPGRTSELFRRAFHHLRTGKLGPVLIEVPGDVLDADIGGPLDYTPPKALRSGPDSSDIEHCAAVLLKASAPVIHAGQGVLYAGATNELVRLAELLDAPVLTTNTGKSAFPENHPLSLGSAVVSAPKMVNHFLKKADCIVAVGASLTRTPWGPKVPAGKTIVHLTNDAGDVNKEFPTTAAAVGDAKLVLEALIAEIGNRKRANGTAAEVRRVREEWIRDWMAELTSAEIPINQYRVIHDLKAAVDPENTIITHDSGGPREQLLPFWESIVPRGYLGWGKSTQLGHGLGLIMGAKLANPGKLCINVMGDASIGMVGMDIETAVRNRIGILTIVFNNGLMAGERDSMPRGIERHNTLDLGGNYADVAKALGSWSRRVVEPQAIASTLKQAIEVTKSHEPAVVEFVVKEGTRFSRY